MPIAPLITAAIETALNACIQDDPAFIRRLARLKGQTIQIHLQDFQRTFTFIFSQQVDVVADYEGQPDCYLSFPLSVLPELRQSTNLTALIKQDKLIAEGDLQLAQTFAQLLFDAKPDFEELLSRVVGDVAAHQLFYRAKQFQQRAQQHYSKQQSQFSQRITEEWRLAPGSLEVAHFCDQVAQVAQTTQTLEQRLEHFYQQHIPSSLDSQHRGTQ